VPIRSKPKTKTNRYRWQLRPVNRVTTGLIGVKNKNNNKQGIKTRLVRQLADDSQWVFRVVKPEDIIGLIESAYMSAVSIGRHLFLSFLV